MFYFAAAARKATYFDSIHTNIDDDVDDDDDAVDELYNQPTLRKKPPQSSKCSGRPQLMTNGHFASYMQARKTYLLQSTSDLGSSGHDYSTDDSPAVVRRKKNQSPTRGTKHVPSRQQLRKQRTGSVILDSAAFSLLQWPSQVLRKIKSMWSLDEEQPVKLEKPPPVDTAGGDLYLRLGLLFGDQRGQLPHPHHGQLPYICPSQSSYESYASVSSLASSSENNPSSMNTSPLSTLTGSEAEAAMSLCSSNRDPSSDSMASLMSGGTSGSSTGSPLSTLPRRHSVTTTAPGSVEEVFGKRRAPIRRSARAGNIKGPIDPKIRFSPYRHPQINLKPQFFEVPQQEKEQVFIGRHWLFKEVEEALAGDAAGVVIHGGVGTGKTSIVLQLVDQSYFGRRSDDAIYQDLGKDSVCASRLSLASTISCLPDNLRSLGGHVVAYHFCQLDNNVTCYVPDFVHNLAAHLCQSPQLAAYRALLGSKCHLQDFLSMKECIANPSRALIEGILEPLKELRSSGKIPQNTCAILIDSLNEAEYHRPDYGDTIATFLATHINKFPPWLKVIMTLRTEYLQITKKLPFHRISLDMFKDSDEDVYKDLYEYTNLRISVSQTIRQNITATGKCDLTTQERFVGHLLKLSKGNFLFTRLTLDLIERGHLVLKSSSFKVLPISLSEVYMLHFNLKFPSLRSFGKVSDILNVCLATLYPLNLLEIYHSINAGLTYRVLVWEDFLQRMDVLSGFLVRRQDGSYMFFHPSFREWLLKRQEGQSNKYLCDPRSGHANIAFRMTRLESPLDAEKTLELGHHVLKAHIYKTICQSSLMGFTSRDMQALWLSLGSADVSNALTCLRNLYSPNVKVSRLLLLSGANPNGLTNVLGECPILSVMAHEGFVDMVSLVLEFGADVDQTNSSGQTALHLAALKGFEDVARILYSRGADINYVDPSGNSSLTYSATNGHLNVVNFLLQNDWPTGRPNRIGLHEAAQQALVSAASNGHLSVCEYLIKLPFIGIDLSDTLHSETPLTAACLNGHKDVCQLLIQHGVSTVASGRQRGAPPLVCAVMGGHWDVADLLLVSQADVDQSDSSGLTSLMMAAAEGHLGIAELLLNKGASVTKVDKDGFTALCWACIKGQLYAAQRLIEHGSNINHVSRTGRTPLDMAADHGEPNVVQFLMDKGALVEHVDHSGMRPLDRAINCRNTDAILCFLKKGAKLGPATWAMAAGKPEVVLLLLNKLMEDGAILYKKNRLNEAAHRYQYALKKFPTDDVGEYTSTFERLRTQMILCLARCKRKMNEHESALELTNKCLETNPKCFEAFYLRARVRRDLKQLKLALEDLEEAMKLAPNNREIYHIVSRIREDIRMQDSDIGSLMSLVPLSGSFDLFGERKEERDEDFDDV